MNPNLGSELAEGFIRFNKAVSIGRLLMDKVVDASYGVKEGLWSATRNPLRILGTTAAIGAGANFIAETTFAQTPQSEQGSVATRTAYGLYYPNDSQELENKIKYTYSHCTAGVLSVNGLLNPRRNVTTVSNRHIGKLQVKKVNVNGEIHQSYSLNYNKNLQLCGPDNVGAIAANLDNSYLLINKASLKIRKTKTGYKASFLDPNPVTTENDQYISNLAVYFKKKVKHHNR